MLFTLPRGRDASAVVSQMESFMAGEQDIPAIDNNSSEARASFRLRSLR